MRPVESTMRCECAPNGVGSERSAVLTLLTGPESGRAIPLPAGEFTIGRDSSANLTIDDESLSRRHARLVSVLDRALIEDLQSTNGTFINGARIDSMVALPEGAMIQLGRNVLLRYSMRDTAEVRAVERAYEATVRDALTGVFNRRHLEERLISEWAYAKRHRVSLAVLFLDIDHFKGINDRYGHGGGDAVLRALGAFLRRAMRTEDLVARYGGEEFVIALRGVDRPGVLVAAERVRSGIEQLTVEHNDGFIPVTASVGVATIGPDRDEPSLEALLAAADGALYRAKSLGRNRVVTAGSGV